MSQVKRESETLYSEMFSHFVRDGKSVHSFARVAKFSQNTIQVFDIREKRMIHWARYTQNIKRVLLTKNSVWVLLECSGKFIIKATSLLDSNELLSESIQYDVTRVTEVNISKKDIVAAFVIERNSEYVDLLEVPIATYI